ncbi:MULTISPECIES: S10 family serine carboxypeptidase-like protein [unclassified Sphingomonas]|uniref:S10 family serine carboxypeptidase-like protein n=1 Tax=unclassified Sphingomonas TaxID=196159 RepID=UPI0006F29BB6|nr:MULTISPECIES: peptidase S10 [unclassified Sphingomonas]KQM62306.1 peptidase S10 [Sphingomonas sp. Leaf16]KQN13710.1 peptidase S10 [Sphingomonas sp. Leaf29]KQN23060.1 peptidase S10 [Sphingomonas sp. Leaf32]
MIRWALTGMILAATAVPAAARTCAPDAVETRHSARIAGRTLTYVACVGALPVRSGTAQARIVYTAYIVPGAARRPISFVWNGGPGADSRTLQFHAVGPRVLRGGALVDNADSPLAATDLVFVDPVGTGFSHAVDPAQAATFYGTVADIAVTADFIESFRRHYRRPSSPINLVGESFGTWRASGVAETLVERGVPVAGVALISGGIPLGEEPQANRRRALSLVNRAATAFALGKLAPALQRDRAATLAEVERWANGVYAPALADPAALDAPRRAAIVAALARYQGLDPATIDPATLWVSPRDFRTRLLAAEGKTLDIFDMRRTGRPEPVQDDAVVLAYYREALGYTTGRYAGIDGPADAVGGQWRYDQSPITPESLARAMAGEGPPSASQPWIQRAMTKAPRLRVWVATGLYDSLNSCAGNAATVAGLAGDLSRRFTLRCYAGGHMMYEDRQETARFGKELAAFLGKNA